MRSTAETCLRASPCLLAALAAFVIAAPKSAQASQLEAKTGAIVFAPDAHRTYGFESAADLTTSKVSLTKWQSGWPPKLTVTPVVNPADLAPYLVADAVEGTNALKLGNGVGIAIDDAALFARVAKSRVQISVWGRADGAAPSLSVRYGRPDWTIDQSSFATITATRTGRETSDGWAEYSTSEIDGSVWGVPIRAIIVAPSFNAPKATTFVVDALEVRPAPGSITVANVCTMADVESSCGATGDCMFGHCVSSVVTWGVMPPVAHRNELVERWILFASNIIGDRSASATGKSTFTTKARDLARYALSPRQFFGGLHTLVSSLRDNHTSFGSPPSGYGNFSPGTFGGWSAALHACFGPMEKDLMGGGLGYGVFETGDEPITSVKLKKGDVVTAIDGRDPKAWVDDVWPQLAGTMPNDPTSDWGWSSQELSAMVTSRANSITLARCTSATKCTGDDRKKIDIDVANVMFKQMVEKGGLAADIKYFGCSSRFHDSVDAIDEAPSGEDSVTVRSTALGITAIQFDGFSGGAGWEGKFTDAFKGSPAKALLDARDGHGGTGQAVEHLLSLTRGPDEPIGFLTVIRGGYDDPDPATLLKDYSPCATGSGGGLTCFGGWGFFSTDFSPPSGGKTKIAWLNTSDVSANDYMPRLLKGRTNLRIFAPHNTSGAFGAITSLPALVSGWGGGSMQYQDSRFGADIGSLSTSRWESSHGVVPDQQIAQTISDALGDRDTILEAARAWLAE